MDRLQPLTAILRITLWGRTNQTQRPGPQDAWIATGARWPGSQERMLGVIS